MDVIRCRSDFGSVCGSSMCLHTEGMNWILMSTLSRVLVIAAGIAVVSVIVLVAMGLTNSYLIFGALVLVIAAIFVHRRDMNRAIVKQLRREADDAAGRRGN